MKNLISYYKNIVNNASPLKLDETDSEFEKYSSLISILKGFEEYMIDLGGMIIGSNLEAVNITGYEEWEVIGKHISMFYTAEDQLTGQPLLDLEKAEERGSVIVSGLRVKKRNSSFWAKIKIRKLLSEEGLHMGYKRSLQDATHKAVTNHRIRKIKDE
jgi:PAS domain S-box-containing protein